PSSSIVNNNFFLPAQDGSETWALRGVGQLVAYRKGSYPAQARDLSATSSAASRAALVLYRKFATWRHPSDFDYSNLA
ncbi:hypothetical protein A4X13_0g7035, partial [Tilletia indica]